LAAHPFDRPGLKVFDFYPNIVYLNSSLEAVSVRRLHPVRVGNVNGHWRSLAKWT
jgi:hypothetical protein